MLEQIRLRALSLVMLVCLHVCTAIGQTVVGPGEVFEITTSTSEDFQLNGGTLAPRDVTLSGLIELQDSSKIIRPQNPLVDGGRGGQFETTLGPTNIDGVISGVGGLEIGNESRDELFLRGDNTYAGVTYITSGSVYATSPTSLGTSAAGTVVQGGNLYVQAATDEAFRIEGGRLFFQAGDFVPAGPLTIAGGLVGMPSREHQTTPVILDSTGGTINFGFADNSRWTGGSSGVGNLTIVGNIDIDAPLNHDGDVSIGRARLNVVNDYTGKTIFTDDYIIDRPDVFGTATSPLEIQSGTTTVNVLPAGDRGFIVHRGTLDIRTAEPIYAGIVLGGSFDATIRGTGTFNGPIDFITSPGGGRAALWSGEFNGPIRGTTDLSFGGGEGPVVLNAANQINGRARVGGGTTIVNHQQAINLPGTQIESGTLELNIPASHLPFMTGPRFTGNSGVLRLNVDQQIQKTWTIDTGTVEANADLRFARVRLLGINGPAALSSSVSGRVNIAGEVVGYGLAEVSGKITGDGNLRSIVKNNGFGLFVTGDHSEFTGNYIAERGRIVLGRSLAGFTEPLILNPAAEIHIHPGGGLDLASGDWVLANDLYVHNVQAADGSSGPFRRTGNGSITLSGQVHVGDVGSTFTESFTLTGQLIGENLTQRFRSIGIESPQTQLRGSLTLAQDASVTLQGAGALHGLDEIVLDNLSNAGIYLRPSENGDRIDDDTLIRSRGGGISLVSGGPTTERLGKLQLERGRTSVIASSDHGAQRASLTIDTIERETGSLLDLDQAGRITDMQFNNIDAFEPSGSYRMIGAWATYYNAFASIDENGRIGTHHRSTTNNINTAGPLHHVRMAGDVKLESDRTIASLQQSLNVSDFNLDLNGHLLRIRSGGILRGSRLENGRLTAGDLGENAELIIHHSFNISADIVDNSETGSVSFVMANDRFATRLSGNNSYTGGTWVHGNGSGGSSDPRLIIENLSAIPVNDRVYLDGGIYNISSLEEGTVKLDELHLRGGGGVSGVSVPIDAEKYLLEHGSVNAPFSGDGIIYKQTPRTVGFGSVESPDFVGQVIVEEGTLSLAPADLAQASYLINGGRVDFSGNRLAAFNEIHLAGVHYAVVGC